MFVSLFQLAALWVITVEELASYTASLSKIIYIKALFGLCSSHKYALIILYVHVWPAPTRKCVYQKLSFEKGRQSFEKWGADFDKMSAERIKLSAAMRFLLRKWYNSWMQSKTVLYKCWTVAI